MALIVDVAESDVGGAIPSANGSLGSLRCSVVLVHHDADGNRVKGLPARQQTHDTASILLSSSAFVYVHCVYMVCCAFVVAVNVFVAMRRILK